MDAKTIVKRVPTKLIQIFVQKGWNDAEGFEKAYEALVTDCNKTVTSVTPPIFPDARNMECNIDVTKDAMREVVREILTINIPTAVREVLTQQVRMNDITKDAIKTFDTTKALSLIMEKEREMIALHVLHCISTNSYLPGKLKLADGSVGEITLNLRVPKDRAEQIRKMLEEQ